MASFPRYSPKPPKPGYIDDSPVLSGPDDRPGAVASFLELPEMDPRIGRFATDLTAGATTEFEKGVLLERFFRDKDLFTYTVDIEPGHSAEDLADWLFTSDSAELSQGLLRAVRHRHGGDGPDGGRSQPGCPRIHPRRDGTGRRGHRPTEERPCLGRALGGRPGLGPLRPHPAQRWGEPGHQPSTFSTPSDIRARCRGRRTGNDTRRPVDPQPCRVARPCRPTRDPRCLGGSSDGRSPELDLPSGPGSLEGSP